MGVKKSLHIPQESTAYRTLNCANDSTSSSCHPPFGDLGSHNIAALPQTLVRSSSFEGRMRMVTEQAGEKVEAGGLRWSSGKQSICMQQHHYEKSVLLSEVTQVLKPQIQGPAKDHWNVSC